MNGTGERQSSHRFTLSSTTPVQPLIPIDEVDLSCGTGSKSTPRIIDGN
jgi:hypothetical protein